MAELLSVRGAALALEVIGAASVVVAHGAAELGWTAIPGPGAGGPQATAQPAARRRDCAARAVV